MATRQPHLVRQCLLDAAQAEFQASGYAGASIADIVARSGRSKPTLFRHFPTKRSLFEGVVERVAQQWATAVDLSHLPTDDPVHWLREYAKRTLAWITNDDNLFVSRMAIAEGYVFPEIGERFRALVSEPMRRVLADRLQAWSQAGCITCPEPYRAAEGFIDLVVSGRMSHRLYHPEDRPSPQELEQHVDFRVALFLNGVR